MGRGRASLIKNRFFTGWEHAKGRLPETSRLFSELRNLGGKKSLNGGDKREREPSKQHNNKGY